MQRCGLFEIASRYANDYMKSLGGFKGTTKDTADTTADKSPGTDPSTAVFPLLFLLDLPAEAGSV
eukprot:scaffold262861_cov20-Prasinocladus_malaysianus.AAC.1